MEELRVQIVLGEETQLLTRNSCVDEERLLIVEIVDIKNNTSEEIFRQIHNVEAVKQWLIENLNFMTDSPPGCLENSGNNLLEAIDNFYENATDDEMEKWLNAMYDYRIRHDLKFAFRGCDVPSVLIADRNGLPCVFFRKETKYMLRQASVAFP